MGGRGNAEKVWWSTYRKTEYGQYVKFQNKTCQARTPKISARNNRCIKNNGSPYQTEGLKDWGEQIE